MRPVVCTLVLSLAMSLCSGTAFAASTLDASATQQLSQLEQRYFSHVDKDESADFRVERLEKLIYGDALTGDIGQRIKKMFAALPKPEEEPAVEPTSPTVFAGKNAPAAPATSAPAVAPAPAAPADPDDDDSTESYPRITSLEKIILGQAYVNERLANRLSRMEVKAFGSANDNLDLSQRTASLERYAEKTLHKKPLGAQDNPEMAQGYSSSSPEYRENVSRSQANYSNGGQQQSQLPKQLMNVVGSSLMGIASSALGVPGIVPALAASGMRASRGPMQGSPQGYESDENEGPPPEDPAVYQPVPPAPSAKFITRVGWCEVQLFQHTFPGLHLRQRLHQISRELNFDTQKSDIALMDDMPGFIKAIQSRKPATNREIGAAGSAPAVE